MNLEALPWAESPMALAILVFLGVFIGYAIRELVSRTIATSSEVKVRHLLETAKQEAKEVLLEAKDKGVKILEEAKSEEKEQRIALKRVEERLILREETLDKKVRDTDKKNKTVDEE